MATENAPFKVLTTSGNQSLMAAGSRPSALAVGQLGIFNAHSGLSVDGTALEDCKDIYIAVGLNRSGAGGGATLEDIGRSAGQAIQTRLAKAYIMKPYIAAKPNIWEVSNFTAKCDTDYALKIEMRSQQSYGINGSNQFANTYTYKTACCIETDCTTCPQGDCNELAQGMANEINLDPDAIQTAILFYNTLLGTVTAGATANGNLTVLVGAQSVTVAVLNLDTAATVAGKIVAAINTATGTAYKATNAAAVITAVPIATLSNPTALISLSSAGGTGVTMGTFSVTTATVATDDASLATFKAAYPGVCLGIRITANEAADVPFNGNIPVKYYSSRDQKLIVSFSDGFDCNGTITEVQTSQIEDGAGRVLAYMEYEAGGFNGRPGPYRTSAVTGLQKGNYDQFINPTANYNVVSLSYDVFSQDGWQQFLNSLETVIAIPCADTTTLTSLIGVLDKIFTQFGAQATAAAAVSNTCVNSLVTTINNYANDGIEVVNA